MPVLGSVLILAALIGCAGAAPTPTATSVPPTPSPTATPPPPSPTQTPGSFEACSPYLDLNAVSDGVTVEAVPTSYECAGLFVDSTGRTPSADAALVVPRSTAIGLGLRTLQPPTGVEVRLYDQPTAHAWFGRWPEDLPQGTEPIDRAMLVASNILTYTPDVAAGAYSLVVRVTWESIADVFYALPVTIVDPM